MPDRHVEGKDKNQLLASLMSTADVGSPVYEQIKMAIMVRCTEDIEQTINTLSQTMDKNSQSSHDLARKVFWLNCAVGFATIVGAIVGVLNIFYKSN